MFTGAVATVIALLVL